MVAQNSFAAAISGFVTARQGLVSTLTSVGYSNEYLLQRVNVVGSDVENGAELLETMHDQALAAFAKSRAEDQNDPVLQVMLDPKYIEGSDEALIEALRVASEQAAVEPFEARMERFRSRAKPTRRLAVAYKAFFIFVRAYQDAIYCMLNERPGGSMNRVVKNGNPIRIYLEGQLPSYLIWFPDFRDLRNKIKDGLGAGISGVTSPIESGALGLNVGATPSVIYGVYHLNDAATALEFSSQITNVTREWVQSKAAASATTNGGV
jgi:hypothetical protein